MILPINIDLSELVDEFRLTSLQTTQLSSVIIDGIIEECSFRWEQEIGKLGSTRQEYQKAVYINRESPDAVVFGLSKRESKLALMIEDGSPPFDEKEGFEKSLKKKQTKNGGWYLTIPFRHATPSAVAESGIFSSIMTPDIYRLAKEASGPLKRSQLPDQHRLPGVRKEINRMGINAPEYKHKSPKYEGLVRVEVGSTPDKKRGQYMTFRRVSNNSDENSWWHTGFEAKKLMDKAIDGEQISIVADKIIDTYLNSIV